VRVPEVEVANGRVVARMPGYQNVIDARIGRRELDGELRILGPDGFEARPFVATLGETWRFFETAPLDNADVSGLWSVQIETDDGIELPGIAQLEQSFGRVTGTVVTPLGDHRFLEGEVRDDELYLSRFDGGSVYLYRGRVDDGGTLAGECWGGMLGHFRWSARRDPDAALPSATTVPDSAGPLELAAVDLDGRSVSLRDPRFAGKVVIVTVSGSWCPNCHDEAALLDELYAGYRERGLEIVSLMFEYPKDPGTVRSAVQRFAATHGIEYPLLLGGTVNAESLERALPQLSGVHAYPTTLFVDRQGRLRRVHAGFTGPATGDRYDDLRQSFVRTVEDLLREPDAA
jgi:thiol-disulfide isomerase/thioredoxin